MQAQFNVQKCEKTLSSEVDIEHIKNMLVRYYSSPEADVRANALKVLFKALDFSDEEKKVFNQPQPPQAQSCSKGWFW